MEASTGIRISFRSGVYTDVPNALSGEVITVWGPEVFRSQVMRADEFYPLIEYQMKPGDPPLPAMTPGQYVPIGIEYEMSHGLTILVRGERIIEDLHIPNYPVMDQEGWSWGIAARSHATPLQHTIRNLQLTSGLVLTGGNLPLQVTLNGQDYDVGGVRFHYYSIWSVFPMIGPSAGGTILRLNGTELHSTTATIDPNSPHGTHRTCRFGGSGDGLVNASVIVGTTDLRCITPYRSSGAAVETLYVSLNGVDYLNYSSFTFYAEPIVSSIEPNSGAALGGTPITIYGSGLLAASEFPICRFGPETSAGLHANEVVPASFVSGIDPPALRCVAPALPARMPAIVYVSLDRQYWTSQQVSYMPLESLGVVSVLPSSGPIRGGTRVAVTANGLSGATPSELRCRFGSTTVNADWDIWTYTNNAAAAEEAGGIACVVPPYVMPVDAATLASLEATLNTTATGVEPPIWQGLPFSAIVEVSANSVDFSMLGTVSYVYQQPPPLIALATIEPPMGPVSGNTTVVINAMSMAGASDPKCKFDGLEVNGTVTMRGTPDGYDSMRCATPPKADGLSGGASLELSLNGQQFSPTDGVFIYAAPPVVTSILPDISPNLGGLVLEISGINFVGGSAYRCRFGPTNRQESMAVEHVWSGGVEFIQGGSVHAPTVEATYDAASDTILCTSPAGLLGYAPVRVSLNAQQYSSRTGPRLTVYDPDSLESLLPGEADTVAQAAE